MQVNGKLATNHIISILLAILVAIVGWLWIRNDARVEALEEKYLSQATCLTELKINQSHILSMLHEIRNDLKKHMGNK